MKKTFRVFILGFFLIFSFTFPAENLSALNEDPQSTFITRGEAVSKVVQGFDLKAKNKKFLQNCFLHLDECFFVFVTKSRFQNLNYNSWILYPDVNAAYPYYDDINTASILELVQGYLDEKESPFRPRAYMSRMEALKIIMGAAGLMDWKERIDLFTESMTKYEFSQLQYSIFIDIDGKKEETWWYPRYVNAALQKNIIDKSTHFRPQELITLQEFNDMMARSLKTAAS